MTASLKLSRWFYEQEQRNCRLPERDAPPPPPLETDRPPGRPRKPAAVQTSSAPTRPDLAGKPRKRLNAEQHQTIIKLIETYPHRPSIVAKEFAKAWPGHTVSVPTVCIKEHNAIKAGKLQL
jgi:hypothetical protein